jgi:hypothetical protein
MTRTKLALILALAACGGGNKPKGPTPGSQTQPAKISGANASYTTGEQVIEAALVALGGRDKLSKLTSMKTVGTVDLVKMGLKGKITIIAAPPRYTLTVIDFPGMGKVQQGTRNDVAWEYSGMQGARIYKGEERATAMREATFNGEANWKELYSKADLGGVVDFEGVKAYKVTLTPKEGGEVITRYYAQDTLLPVGYETIAKTQMGDLPVKAFETDYKEVGGLKFAHTVKRSGGFDANLTIESIELSAAIDPSTFDPPEQVRALIK